MMIYYYQTETPAEAFDAASKDDAHWNHAERMALGEMATAFREGFTPSEHLGSGRICSCDSAAFLLFDDNGGRGYGISLLQLPGHESGIDDPVAQELLDLHRIRRGEAFFADSLLIWSASRATLADLDHGYQLLVQARFIDRTDTMVTIKDGNAESHQRPAFMCRSSIRSG